jgi:protoporphyrinogen IX oxidase
MKLILAFHIISIVCWFAGLFYLPRLYVYHAAAKEKAVWDQFKVMEHKLYYYITTPAMILTVIFGLCLWLPHYDAYRHAMWLHFKLPLVLALIIYHFHCGIVLHEFKKNNNKRSHRFYRFYNEIPTIILIAVVILSVLKP